MSQLLRRPRAEGCPSGLMLDRLTVGELQGAERDVIQQHLQGCVACAARLAENETFRMGFEASAPPLRARAPVARPAATWRARWPLLLTGTLAAAAAALIPGLTERGTTTRSKGDPRLDFFVATSSGGVERGTPGDTLMPGSRVQFVYSHPAPVWLAVLSMDGAGRASIYFPEGGTTAAPLPAGLEQPLPVSTVLDEALGPERIFGLFCQAPVALAPLRDALAGGATEPPVPPGCRLSRLTWVKRRPR